MIKERTKWLPRLGAGLLLTVVLHVLNSSVECTAESCAGKTITLTLPGEVELEMVRIPAGVFKMGSPKKERGRSSDEGPVHKVSINYPVSHISWDSCQAFIRKLNQLGQGTFRLPSEAEWEYACRAGTRQRFYFGNSSKCGDTNADCKAGTLSGNRSDYMWYCGNNSSWGEPDFGAKPVGQKLPNTFGLYDMHGNVWEWCLDEYHSNYKGAPTDGSAWQTKAGTPRVLRGGAWDYHAWKCRSAARCGYTPGKGYTFHGLRLVWFPYAEKSPQWYASWVAEVIGDNIISYQSKYGGWPKNVDMTSHGYQGEKFTKNWGTTIDNSATYTQMDFLGRVYHATKKKRFK
ncbi:MAG: formylglycine-generating enzyme family protein, partial [Planctomycetota bacterium]